MKREINVKRQMDGKTPVKPKCGFIAIFGAGCTKQNKLRRNIMKFRLGKHFILAAVIVLSLLVAPLYAATHTVTFTKEGLLFSEVDGYDLALLKDGAYMTDVGKPQLPTKSLRVIIPPGSTVADITIEETSKVKLEGIFTIYPAQEFKADFLPPPPFAEPDPVVYGQANEYPGDLVTCMGESYVGGSYEVAHLVVFPLQYVPQSGELHLYKSINFTLTLVKGGPDVPKIRTRSKSSQESWDLLARETVINPEDAEAYRVSPEIIGDSSMEAEPMRARIAQAPVNNGTAPCDYIIITSDTTMADAFMPLAAWRIKKGIPTEIFTVSWIESNHTGADTPEKIKNFIYDCYANRGAQHVLLGGNSDLVPVRYSYIYHYDSHHNGEAATDLYYSNCMVGDEEWEVYEGPKFPTPHVTYNPPVGCSMDALIPRLNVGRLLVADEEQAGDVINKIMTYERDLPAIDYQETFLYHAADEGGRIGYQTKVDSVIPDYLRPNTRTLMADGTDADGRSTPENIIRFMMGGSDLGVPFNFVWSVSHANQCLLTTNTISFTSNHIDQIINQPRFNGSFYAWGCTSAAIGSTDPTILPTRWVNLPDGGGLAWIGSSIVAGGDRGEWHARYYHEEMWEESDDYHHHNLGRAFAEAKTRMIESWPDNPFDPATSWCEYHAIIWNLVGDPLVPMFNRMPRTLNVTVSEQHMEPGVASTLNITVGDDSNPVEGALVCVMKSDEDMYLTDYTDGNGVCRFQMPAMSLAGGIDVTVTKYNYRPYELTLNVDADPNINKGLVGYWNFNEGAGKVVSDYSGNGNEGVVTEATWADGKYGAALSFDDVNDLVEIPDDPLFHFTNQMTVSAWVKTTPSAAGTIVNKWYAMDCFNLSYGYGDFKFTVAFPGGQWGEWKSVTAPANVDTWVQVAGVFDGEKICLYINGQLEAFQAASGTLQDSGRPISIGNHPSWDAFEGVIDEVRLYNRALSESEIQTLYCIGLPLETYYLDADGDGYGDPDYPIRDCTIRPWYVKNADDCDDNDPDTYLGAMEIFDGKDNDCDGEIEPMPLEDMTELNAADWTSWAAGSNSENTYVEDDTTHKLVGSSSLKFVTDGGFDTYIRYPDNFTALWDLTGTTCLMISFFALNPHIGFQQGSPWIRLKDAEGNYFEYQYYKNGQPYDLLNEARNKWCSYNIPLHAPASTDNGWRRTTNGSPDLAHIRYIEIYADTWDYGFTLWIDGVGFDPVPTASTDIDVTFIDRIPHYAYDADKNKPEVGDTVTFISHAKLYADGSLNTNYMWYMDGLPIGDGDILLEPGKDNTASIDWIWDNKRHEIMIVFDPENVVIEESEENNILYDFTDALIVGMAVERGLVDVFSHFQKDLGIGSMSFEDWFQRQIKIWNTVLMEKAGELKSDKLLDVQDRVRGVLSYHEDGSLKGGNCPLIWKDVDMLWGKLVSDIEWYHENKWAWFYEGSLPHELSHARYLPDTYILDLPARFIEIVDDSGFLVTETDYMPTFSWDVVYDNKNQGMMTGDYAGRYSLFNTYLSNRIAGERAQGCNTNGCCGHDTDWFDVDFPEAMYLRILHMAGSPRVNARLDIYQREGRYGNVKVDNIIDYTLYTDSNGRALLPTDAFTNSSQEFVLKIIGRSVYHDTNIDKLSAIWYNSL